jgi:predicted N-acetyltransferase YhbS
MDQLVKAADHIGSDPLMMIGDADYYGRFWGFSAMATGAWRAPGPFDPARLLARASGPASGMMLPRAGMLGPRQIMLATA